MREFRSAAQSRELRIGLGRIGTDQFDRGTLAGIGQLGEENGAMVRAAQIEDETVSSVDNLAFLLFPGIGHMAPAASSGAQRRYARFEGSYLGLWVKGILRRLGRKGKENICGLAREVKGLRSILAGGGQNGT